MTEQPIVADARVRAATGRGRHEWFALLDAAEASTWEHPAIARWLAEEHGVDGWWAQQVTVDYEFARGLRARHQRPDGFAITKSKTLPAPVEAVYAAWVDDAARARWLGNEFEISSTREHSSVRGRWAGGPSRIAVGLAAKGADKTQVQVQHEKLATAEDAEQAKRAWAERLTRPCSPTPDGAGMGVSAHDVVVR